MPDCDLDAGTGLLTCCWPDPPLDRCCPDPTDEAEAAQIERAIAIATAILTRRSGYTVGLCMATLRPLGPCRVCRSLLCCGAGDWLHLSGPLGLPISAVVGVRLGPDPYEPSDWRWDASEGILWAVPPLRWPMRDEKWSECGFGEAFCIDVVVGNPPDAWALDVAAALACELVKSCRGDKCRLPKNATSVSGQGITVSLSDREIGDLIPEVSAWLTAVNPHGAMLPARISSPDLHPVMSGGCCG